MKTRLIYVLGWLWILLLLYLFVRFAVPNVYWKTIWLTECESWDTNACILVIKHNKEIVARATEENILVNKKMDELLSGTNFKYHFVSNEKLN